MKEITFLLDANLSPETANFLRSLGYGVVSLIEDKHGDLDDEAVAEAAGKKHQILFTFDLDFGEIYFLTHKKQFSVIILRLRDQRVESVNAVLATFLENNINLFLKRKSLLVVIRERQIRIMD